MSDYMTFQELYEAVERATSESSSDTALVKNAINMVYLTEICEADDLYPLFWLRKLDETLAAKAPATITGITGASPAVVTAVAHGFANGDIVSIYSVVGMTEVNNRTYLVSNRAADTFELETVEAVDVDSSGYTAYTSGGTIVHRGLTLATTGINVQRILQAAWHGEKPMREITIEQLEEVQRWWDDNTERPKRWLHKKLYSAAGVETNQLWWFPGSDAAYDLRYWALTRPARLSATTDVPILPPQFHDAIVSGAISRLIESHVQIEGGAEGQGAPLWPALYTLQLNNLRIFNRNYYRQQEIEKREGPYLL